ncbi:hypothetical protein A3850_016985 [Lewinella sp. 4G2]|nr:hypothetical protein A3850_016985 [Lewinella sp. 4G2]
MFGVRRALLLLFTVCSFAAYGQLNVEVTGQDLTCNSIPQGIAVATADGGTAPYAYAWSNGETTSAITNLTAGEYTVTVTDAANNTVVGSVTLNEPDRLNVSITEPVECDEPFEISIVASGGTAPYDWTWSTGETTESITVPSGNYCVTLVDNNLCGFVTCRRVAPNNPLVTVASVDVTCPGNDDGSLDATATAGTPPYTYAWSNGATGPTLDDLAPGDYTVTLTDSRGCTDEATATVNEPDPIEGFIFGDSTVCPGVRDAFLRIAPTGGTGEYSYVWSFMGQEAQGIGPIGPGVYSITVTDENGCTLVDSYTIVESPPIEIVGSVEDIACFGQENGSIATTVSGGMPPYTYAWSTGATTSFINDLAAGDYSLTVTDIEGCVGTSTFAIEQNDALSIVGTVIDLTCEGDSSGVINIDVSGGDGDYDYLWNDGATTEDRTGLAAGTYSITATDGNDCTTEASYTVEEPDALVVNLSPTNPTCSDSDDGIVLIGIVNGTMPFTITVNGEANDGTLNNVSAGTYLVEVTDGNGCFGSMSVTLTAPDAIELSAEVTNINCFGDNDGSIDLSVGGGTPGYTYAWSNGATSQDIDDLEAGNYTVTVTDANNCTAEATYTINTNTALVVTGVVTDINCNGDATGAITTSVMGGDMATISYAWSTGATTADLDGLTAGNYSVTVMDANACAAVANFTVTEPDAIDLSVQTTDNDCNGDANGTASVLVSGGTQPYEITWSNGAVGTPIVGLPAGTESVTVTDANGCTAVAPFTITEPDALTCTVNVLQESTLGDNGSLSVTGTGGTGAYTYLWNTGATTQTISDLAPGTYSATVTDANGCTTVCSETLAAFAGLGNFVWLDYDADGQQDPNEPGVAGYTVFLKNANGDIIDETVTDANGMYAFNGLVPGDYSVLFPELPGNIRTEANQGADAGDSDADPAMNGMTGIYNLEAGEFDPTVDAGFVPVPTGELDECNCLSNASNPGNGQFQQTITVTASPGQTWTVTDRTGMFTNLGTPTAPLPIGTELTETPDPDNANQSLYVITFRVIDGQAFSATVSNGLSSLSFANQCDYPTLSFQPEPPSLLCTFDSAVALNAVAIEGGVATTANITYTINDVVVTELDPSTLAPGTYVLSAVYTSGSANGCTVDLERTIEITDDCMAKLGDFVWEDLNGNGMQDPGEPGIEGVKVTVNSQDGSFMDMQFTDENGMYMFMVNPGTYKLTFEQPADLTATQQNMGNDGDDSDVDPQMLMTPFYTVGPNGRIPTIDAGFTSPCIDNVDDPGAISGNQTLCGPGNVPDELVETAPATGGQGELQYLWMMTTVGPDLDIDFWTPIPNTNTENYQPGAIYENTYFARCVRRGLCRYRETEPVLITVGDAANAQVSGTTRVCVGEDATFTALNPTPGNLLTWNFGGPAEAAVLNGPVVTNSWTETGLYNANLTASGGGCVSRDPFLVNVIANPASCGGNLTATGVMNNLANREVTIEWTVPNDGSFYQFELERSTNGVDFEMVREGLTEAAFMSGSDAIYRQSDVSPVNGRNFYRIRLIDAEFGDLMSNVVELNFAAGVTTLGRVFPNPSNNGFVHVELSDRADVSEGVGIRLFDAQGRAAGTSLKLPAGTVAADVDVRGLQAGIYVLQLTVGGEQETIRVVIN